MLPSKVFKEYFPRRMLLHSPFMVHQQPSPPPLPSDNELYETSKHGINFDVDVVMIFSVLLCLLVFSIFVNCVIKCLFKCLIWFNTRQAGSNNNLGVHNKVVISRGVPKRALRTFPLVKYSKEVKLQGLSGECVICLSEFKEGERVRILPKCHHGFHVKCIDKWLGSHSSCPTCRQSLVDTCQKIIGCVDDDRHQANSSSSSSSREMIGISIESLDREDFVRN